MYLRYLFSRMVTAKESKTFWNTSYLDHMAFLQLEQNCHSLPFFNLPGSNTDQENTVNRFLKQAPTNRDILCPTKNPFLKDSQNPLIPDPLKKKFLIFDHSGNQTRLFFSPSFSPQYPIFAANALPASAADAPIGKTAARANPEFLLKPMIVEEKWDENHLSDGEDENDMLEDSKEIDALFYSDSSDDDDDDDDEVTSPFTIEEGYIEEKLLEEPTKQVASSDGSPKRRKLLDGNYNKSSRAIISSDAENYDDDINSSKREKKVQIRRALRMLESIIQGPNRKDPLSVINNAIIYLKSMRVEAKALGLSYPEGKSVISL